MKFLSVVLAVLAAATVNAAAAPAPAPYYISPWCDHPGQPCLKMKRAADALAEALASVDEE